ncbi:MAG: hypothetical protein LBL04_15930 [Bacteroidales bacterium]|nr:hypothetical protein [Bacteroidales bacterium]
MTLTGRWRLSLLAVKKLPATGRKSLLASKNFPPPAGSRCRQEITSRHRQGVIAGRKSLPAIGRELLPAGNHFPPSAGSHCRQETISRHRQGVNSTDKRQTYLIPSRT